MCLAIVYGAYEVFWTPSTRKAPKQPVAAEKEDLRKFVGEVTQKLLKEKLPEEAVYRVKKASSHWTKDPFIQTSAPLSQEKPADVSTIPTGQPYEERPDLIYTGYLELGPKKIAVISGTEYTVGEALGVNDLYVKRISSQSVIIGKVKSEETIQLPLFESTE